MFIGGIIKFLLGMFMGKALSNPAILGSLGGLLANGGLGKILGSLKGGGMGSAVDSWVGTGKNKLVTGDEVEAALGKDQMSDLARRAGVPADRFKDQFAEHLPGMVDKLTPNGKLPNARDIDSSLQSMGWSGNG
jgi:uncharacterized protein YidB (DUF937 family)